MKKSLMILGNVLIVLLILTFLTLYTSSEHRRLLASQTEAFENMTVAMENVTTNYLLGEQQVCRSWANYINASRMTAQEAIDFVCASVTAPEIMAHILFTDRAELSGLSTVPKAGSDGDFAVSYANINIFSGGFDELLGKEGTVNVTRAYTNPTNAIQSIAFCRQISLKDEEKGGKRSAMLLRVVPVSLLTEKWVFPTASYENASISLLNADGDYVIQGSAYKNSNFYVFLPKER